MKSVKAFKQIYSILFFPFGIYKVSYQEKKQSTETKTAGSHFMWNLKPTHRGREKNVGCQGLGGKVANEW
jgi:hypothetical protein